MLRSREREGGSILVLSLILIVAIAGMSASALLLNLAYSRASSEDLDQELARTAAESGLAYYLGESTRDANYLATAALGVPSAVGDGTFSLLDAVPGPSAGQWDLTLEGLSGRGIYRMKGIIGNPTIRFPNGIVAAGTGNNADTILTVSDQAVVGSYDPTVAGYDPASPGDSGNVAANGSLLLANKALIHGDVSASGNVTGDPVSVTGNLVANGPETPIDDINPIVWDHYNTSRVSNDNGNLSGIFGSQWTPESGSENYGNLVVADGGTYVIPAGTYRFRTFEVLNHSRVIFDTSAGPVNLVYVGAGKGTGRGNDLTVENFGSVMVDSGGTSNGLLTVLGPDADFKVSDHSIYGQNTDGSDAAGYTQIISLGGNTSSDDIIVQDQSSVYARVYAAAHTFTVGNQAAWYGSVLARKVSLANGATFAVDESSLGNSLVDPSTYAVLGKWRLR